MRGFFIPGAELGQPPGGGGGALLRVVMMMREWARDEVIR